MRQYLLMGGILAVSAWSVGCAPGIIEGDVATSDYEFGKMSTVYFDMLDDGSGISYFYLSDYKWSCEEFQEAAAADTEVKTKESDTVVAYALFTINKYNSSSDFYGYTSEEGTYKILDDFRDVSTLSDGTLYSFGYFGFQNDLETVDILFAAENGTLTLEKVDIEKSVDASFTLSLDDGSQLTGSFSASPCELPD